ncbi:hypothetical protein MKX03_000883, partial [Papaver bracteatum]
MLLSNGNWAFHISYGRMLLASIFVKFFFHAYGCKALCILLIIGEVANFVAYAFAPAVLVTPLGALSIIVRLHKLAILGCVICIFGSIIIVTHAPQEHPITSVIEIWNMATQTAFLLYVASVIVLVFILVFHFALWPYKRVMSVKALGMSLKLTYEGNNQLIYPETWFFLLVVVTCVVTQMNYLNK